MKKSILSFLIFLSMFLSTGKTDWIVNACGLPYDSKLPCIIVRDSMWFAATDYGVFYSVYENSHWMNGTPGISDGVFNCVSFFGKYIIAGSEMGNFYLSTVTDPPHFVKITNNIPVNSPVNSITTCGNYIFAGRTKREVWVSQDTGKTWTNRTSNLPANQVGKVYLFTNGNVVYAATDGAGIYKTTNYGVQWIPVNTGLTSSNVRSICFHNSKMFAGTVGGGVFLLSDNGQYWSQKNTGLGNLSVNAFATLNNRLVAGTDNGVYVSANNGDSWYPRNAGLPENSKALCFAISSQLHVGLETLMSWSIEIDEIVPVKSISDILPDKYSLSQNFPNPFNPSTVIRFQIPENGFTTLKVFDLLGREISTLISEEMKAGRYEARFNAGLKLPSGIYLYKLEVNSPDSRFTSVKKMTLLK